jgi:hypothetical protein
MSSARFAEIAFAIVTKISSANPAPFFGGLPFAQASELAATAA